MAISWVEVLVTFLFTPVAVHATGAVAIRVVCIVDGAVNHGDVVLAEGYDQPSFGMTGRGLIESAKQGDCLAHHQHAVGEPPLCFLD